MGNIVKYVAITADGETARYGYANGVGHIVLSGVVRAGGDHIGGAGADGMPMVCGSKSLDVDRVEAKFRGDRMCKSCDKWENSDGGFNDVEAARVAAAGLESGPSVADMIAGTPGAHVITLDGVSVPGDVSESTPGNTDRVTAALETGRKAAAAKAAQEYGTDADDDADNAIGERERQEWARADAAKLERSLADREARKAKRDAAVADHKIVLRERRAKRAAARAAGESVPAPVVMAAPKDVPAPACDADGMDKETMLRLTSDVPVKRADGSCAATEAELRDAADGTAGKREGQVRKWVRATDSKCSVRVSVDALGDAAKDFGTPDADGMVTVPLSGRMLMPVAEAVAAGVKGASVVPVGKSAGALAPLPLKGGPENGIQGVCPVCREVVTVGGSGGVGTHRAGGVTPDAPQLSQREVPAVDGKGEPTRDAAKRRQGEAYRREVTVTLDPMAPVADQVAAVMAAVNGDARANGVREVTVSLGRGLDGRERRTADLSTAGDAQFGASSAPVGVRDHGRSDGVAMSPRGETGYAGWTFDRGEAFVQDKVTGQFKEVRVKAPTSRDVVGGEFGWKSQAEYDAMSKRAQKRYRQTVNTRKQAAQEVREAERAARRVAGAKREAAGKESAAVALDNVMGFLADVAAGKGETRRKRMQSGTTGHNPVDNGAHFTHTDVSVVKVDASKRTGKKSARRSA